MKKEIIKNYRDLKPKQTFNKIEMVIIIHLVIFTIYLKLIIVTKSMIYIHIRHIFFPIS